MKFFDSTTVIAATLAAVVMLGITPAARAQYPDRPIKNVVAYPPGGATDVMARAVAQRLDPNLD